MMACWREERVLVLPPKENMCKYLTAAVESFELGVVCWYSDGGTSVYGYSNLEWLYSYMMDGGS